MYVKVKQRVNKKQVTVHYLYLCKSERVNGKVINTDTYIASINEEKYRTDSDYVNSINDKIRNIDEDCRNIVINKISTLMNN